jgi:hypothetical protein
MRKSASAIRRESIMRDTPGFGGAFVGDYARERLGSP